MLTYDSVSNFLLTGCAVAPALALITGHPAFALASHAILLILGIVFAAGDREALFRQPGRFDRDRSSS